MKYSLLSCVPPPLQHVHLSVTSSHVWNYPYFAFYEYVIYEAHKFGGMFPILFFQVVFANVLIMVVDSNLYR